MLLHTPASDIAFCQKQSLDKYFAVWEKLAELPIRNEVYFINMRSLFL